MNESTHPFVPTSLPVVPSSNINTMNFQETSQSRLATFLLACIGVFSLLLAVGASDASAQEIGLAVAVNNNSPVTTMSKSDAKKIFSAKKVSWGSTRLVLVLMPKGSPEMTWLCKTVLGMPESAYRRHLLEKVFKGKISRPMQATSVDHALMLLASNKGAIGILPLKSIAEAKAIVKTVYK